MPGLKFYPGTSRRIISYAIGLSAFYSSGKTIDNTYFSNPDDQHYKVYGLILNNYLNVSIAHHFYIDLDFGFGFPTGSSNVNVENYFLPILGQLSFKLGYRF